jgi:hypothetical protein
VIRRVRAVRGITVRRLPNPIQSSQEVRKRHSRLALSMYLEISDQRNRTQRPKRTARNLPDFISWYSLLLENFRMFLTSAVVSRLCPCIMGRIL